MGFHSSGIPSADLECWRYWGLNYHRHFGIEVVQVFGLLSWWCVLGRLSWGWALDNWTLWVTGGLSSRSCCFLSVWFLILWDAWSCSCLRIPFSALRFTGCIGQDVKKSECRPLQLQLMMSALLHRTHIDRALCIQIARVRIFNSGKIELFLWISFWVTLKLEVLECRSIRKCAFLLGYNQ